MGATGSSQGLSDWVYPPAMEMGLVDFSMVVMEYNSLQRANSSLQEHLASLKAERLELL